MRSESNVDGSSGLSPLGWVELTVPCVFSDYKNNLLKAKASLNSPPKVIDLDKGNSHYFVSTFTLVEHPLMLITEVYV